MPGPELSRQFDSLLSPDGDEAPTASPGRSSWYVCPCHASVGEQSRLCLAVPPVEAFGASCYFFELFDLLS